MAKSSRKAAKVFLVERAAFGTSDYDDTPKYYVSDGEEGPSFVPVRAFADKAAADACRKELEAIMPAELHRSIPDDALTGNWYGLARYWRKKEATP